MESAHRHLPVHHGYRCRSIRRLVPLSRVQCEGVKPVASMSLIAALSFLLVAPMALQAHLGHPERAFSIFLSPNRTSAMAGFGYIWAFYRLLVVGEIGSSSGPTSSTMPATIPACGGCSIVSSHWSARDYAPRTACRPTPIKVLATAGIPAACVLHGYVGFLFGAINANPWWSTPLTPPIFLCRRLC